MFLKSGNRLYTCGNDEAKIFLSHTDLRAYNDWLRGARPLTYPNENTSTNIIAVLGTCFDTDDYSDSKIRGDNLDYA